MVVVDAMTSPPFVSTRQLALLVAVTVVFGGPVHAQTPDLPEKAPVPQIHPPPAGNIPPERLGEPPVPEPKPEAAPDALPEDGKPGQPPAPTEGTDADPEEKQALPATDAPLPEQKPSETAAKTQELPEIPADPRSAMPRFDIIPPDETTCRARLRALGAVFEERPAQSDPAGCALPYPLAVKRLSAEIALEPEALMNCAMAETAARFAADIISPAAKAEYGEELKSVGQASAYVCRPRNGGSKLSEHAFGNALDIARFTLSKGTAVDVKPAPDPKAAKFLGAIRKAACGPFKTVLGPGSDADHALHFHFDLAPRRNGGTFCQ
ncbi:extensin family protein [Allomesorhizobium camelthorni]|uniref:Extensin family protein n=1 Tax=Allomesorhizobium camelthorni TaxID=475069 RepID=A0A6G4WJ80_9HYPH|nr:extensin family protein [Mesorhizobium camelthorni]NGO54418.1 extensin family protein [Mesorhizobium camelthorni]